MGEFPSGQRGQTVNLLRIASMVRIRPPPPIPQKFIFLVLLRYFYLFSGAYCSTSQLLLLPSRNEKIRKNTKKNEYNDVKLMSK